MAFVMGLALIGFGVWLLVSRKPLGAAYRDQAGLWLGVLGDKWPRFRNRLVSGYTPNLFMIMGLLTVALGILSLVSSLARL